RARARRRRPCDVARPRDVPRPALRPQRPYRPRLRRARQPVLVHGPAAPGHAPPRPRRPPARPPRPPLARPLRPPRRRRAPGAAGAAPPALRRPPRRGPPAAGWVGRDGARLGAVRGHARPPRPLRAGPPLLRPLAPR